jgi:hypothetical protein
MKRIAWPVARRNGRAEEPDPAPVLLDHIAAGIEKRAPTVLRSPVVTVIEPSLRGAWSKSGIGCRRSWSCEARHDIRVWLIVDEAAARNLLEIVLGGPASKRPTALEQEIVKETVERMCSTAGLCWEEDGPTWSPPPGDAWRCTMSIDPPSGNRVRIDLIAPAVHTLAPPAAPQIDVDRIPIRVHAAFTSEKIPLSVVATWQPGTIVSLQTDVGAAAVGLFAGAKSFATGRLGVSLRRRAVMIQTVDTFG